MRDVVVLRAERQWARLACAAKDGPHVMGRRAHSGAVRFRGGRLESALEITPRDTLRVQEVADVLVVTGELHLVPARAIVAERLRVTDHCALPVAGVFDHVACWEGQAARHEFLCNSVGLTGDEVEMTGSGRPECGVIRVVAQRVVLSVVPQSRH